MNFFISNLLVIYSTLWFIVILLILCLLAHQCVKYSQAADTDDLTKEDQTENQEEDGGSDQGGDKEENHEMTQQNGSKDEYQTIETLDSRTPFMRSISEDIIAKIDADMSIDSEDQNVTIEIGATDNQATTNTDILSEEDTEEQNNSEEDVQCLDADESERDSGSLKIVTDMEGKTSLYVMYLLQIHYLPILRTIR